MKIKYFLCLFLIPVILLTAACGSNGSGSLTANSTSPQPLAPDTLAALTANATDIVITPSDTPLITTENRSSLSESFSGYVMTSYGAFSKRYAERIPVSIMIPLDWVEPLVPAGNPEYPLFQVHSENSSSQLTITEPTFQELQLQEMTLDEYANIVISSIQTLLDDFNLISARKYNYTTSVTIAVLHYTGDGGRMFYRLIYIYEGTTIFNLTYAFRPDETDITGLVDYSFASFKVEPGIRPNAPDITPQEL